MPEWEYLGKALDEAQGDRGSLAFVTGEAGIGKSRLLAELCEVARQRGFRVLSGRAVDTGTPVTFRPLFEALSGWFRHGGPPQEPHLDVIRAALAQLVPEWRRPGETPYRASPVELGEALLRLLTHIAAGHGCVLVLEDLHWADLDTVAVLEYLGDNLAAAPVQCLATLRSESAAPALRVARALAARRSGAILELCRLSSAELVRMTQLHAAVVEREHLADRGQARPAGQGGQGGVGTADVIGRGEPFQAVDVAWRGPRLRCRQGGKGSLVDGAGQQRPPASFVRGDVTVRERRPLIELEDEHLAGREERPVQGRVGHPGAGQ
jgi:AAA ATPase domain